MKTIRYLIRVILWALKSLWRKYPKPTRERRLYSRSFMRKLYRPLLREIDRAFNAGGGVSFYSSVTYSWRAGGWR